MLPMPLPCPATLPTPKPDRRREGTAPVRSVLAGQQPPSVGDGNLSRAWPTQNVAWIRAAARHLCAPHEVRTLPADGPDATAGLSEALRVSVHTPSGRRQPRLTLPGAHVTGEPCDLPPGQATALLRQLAAQPMALELPRVPANSATPDAIRQAYAGRAIVRVFEAPGAPYVELDDTWTDPLQRFNAGRRSDFRRAEQHARRMGGAHPVFHDDLYGPALESCLDTAFEVEARSWKGRAGSALAHDLPMGRFIRDVARAAARSGELRLAFLQVDGRPAAMQIAVASSQRLWLLKIGYDPAFARCRPGQLLLLHTLARAAREGLRSCELMGHAAAWTVQWTTTLRACVGIRVYPMTRPGLHAWGEDVADALARRLRGVTARFRADATGASHLTAQTAPAEPDTPAAMVEAAGPDGKVRP